MHNFCHLVLVCNTWKGYWRQNDGKCIAKHQLVVGGGEAKVGQFPEMVRTTNLSLISPFTAQLYLFGHPILPDASRPVKNIIWIVKIVKQT